MSAPVAALAQVRTTRHYVVTGAPNLCTDTKRPVTIRPTTLEIDLWDGEVVLARVSGVTIRKDGSEGTHRPTVWPKWDRSIADAPAWVSDVIRRDGLKWRGGHRG